MMRERSRKGKREDREGKENEKRRKERQAEREIAPIILPCIALNGLWSVGN